MNDQQIIEKAVELAEGFFISDPNPGHSGFWFSVPQCSHEVHSSWQFGLDALAAQLVRQVQKLGYQVLVNHHWSGEVRLSIYNTTNGGDFCQHYDDGILRAIVESGVLKNEST